MLYAGAVWALAQGISQLSPAFGAPDWVTRWFVIAACVGFPFWVAFAWFYEFTPQEIQRESEVAPSASVTHSTARKLDFAIIGVLIVAVVLLGSGYFIRRDAPAAATPAKVAAAFHPAADSLMVLPFANLSGDKSQQYFSDGITEELTGALGQNPSLTVIAWHTASKYRDSKQTAGEMGRTLNVAHILDGSIQREGNEVRVSVELVSTVTGRQLWSRHYDQPFKDIFKVQDQVSEAIADALKVKFAQADLPQGGTTNPEAHELVLKGRALMEKRDAASFAAAQKDFEQAIALDPDYADAHALLARALLVLTVVSDLPRKTVEPRIRAEAERALALDPHNVDALVAMGNVDSIDLKPERARAEFRQALALDPSNEAAHLDYGTVLPLKQAVAQEQEATLLDPNNVGAWNNLATYVQDLGDYAQETTAAEALLRLDPTGVDSAFGLAFAYQQLRQLPMAVKAFDRVQPANAPDRAQVAAGRLTYQALLDPALRPQALAALQHLGRDASNPDVASNLLQLYLALGETQSALPLLESLCAATPIGCSDLAINPLYRALHGDPRFEALAKKYTTVTAE